MGSVSRFGLRLRERQLAVFGMLAAEARHIGAALACEKQQGERRTGRRHWRLAEIGIRATRQGRAAKP